MVGVRARVLSFIGKLGNSPDDRASRVRFPSRGVASLSAQALRSTYSWPGSGFNAYLRFFREGSASERRDLTRLGALFVGADDPGRSGFFPSRLREKAPAEKIRIGTIHLPSKRAYTPL